MRRAICWLFFSGALIAQTRYARVSDIEGKVETRVHPAEPWIQALRNMPLVQGTQVTTADGSQAEIELDEGSVVRLGSNSSLELADYLRLSTGQRITHAALDRGIVYFSGEPRARDALSISAPGLQASPRRGSRVRIETGNGYSQLTVIEGEVHVSTPGIDLDIREGKTFRADVTRPDKFALVPEVAPLDSDAWSRERDKLLPLRFGMRDVDLAGDWIMTAEFGQVWKPKMPAGWIPFRDGRWVWYAGLGYTWIGAESWSWLPYHTGRWMLQPSLGWVWAPSSPHLFLPGEVYWMRGPDFIGWGPLAPGEWWTGAGPPQLYATAHTTFAAFTPGAPTIDPAGFAARPADPLLAARFAVAAPPVPPLRHQIEWVRQIERAGDIRLIPALSAPLPAVESRRRDTPAPPPSQSVPPAPTQTTAVSAPPPPAVAIQESVYFVPVYSGIIVLNPPEKPAPKKKTDRDSEKAPREGGNRRGAR